jgi:rhomboid family GlyGly-CTERM serine protease
MTSQAADRGESQGGFRPPWLTLSLTVLVAALYAAAGPTPEALLFDRQAIAAGEVWRLLTGHLVHADAAHLCWNLAALVPIGALLEQRADCRGWTWAGLFLAGVLAVDAWLLALAPGVPVYCGVSGVLNALYGALALLLWRRSGQILFLVAVLCDLAKIVLEAAGGGAILPTGGWTSVPGVHLAGLAAGLAFVLALYPVRPEPGSLAPAGRPG